MHLNVENIMFQNQVYLKSPDKAKEYLLINYLIKNEYQVIAGIYNNDDGVVICTVPNQDRRTVCWNMSQKWLNVKSY